MERPEHLVEEPDVAELLAEVVAADLFGRLSGLGHRGDLVPGGRDADPLMPGELVEEGQQQRLAVEGPRIVLHPDVVAVEALGVGQRLAGADGVDP